MTDLYATWHGFDLKLSPNGLLTVDDQYHAHIRETKSSKEYPSENEDETRERIVNLLFSGEQFTITVQVYTWEAFGGFKTITIYVCNDVYDIFTIDIPMF